MEPKLPIFRSWYLLRTPSWYLKVEKLQTCCQNSSSDLKDLRENN
jgi:hypothetical protein